MKTANHNDNEKEDIDTIKKLQKNSKSIFSKEEKETIAKEFILAFLRGDLTINFPLLNQYLEEAKLAGQQMDWKTAKEKEMKNKKYFMDLISIVAENKKATVQEKEQAISDLFDSIFALRCGERIKGTFGKQANLEARLCKIEEEMSAANELIQQLVIWYRSFLQRK